MPLLNYQELDKQFGIILNNILTEATEDEESSKESKIFKKIHILEACLRAEWRSMEMNRRILKFTDWKRTDIVFMGAFHSIDISAMLGHEISKMIYDNENTEEGYECLSRDYKNYSRVSALIGSLRKLKRRIKTSFFV